MYEVKSEPRTPPGARSESRWPAVQPRVWFATLVLTACNASPVDLVFVTGETRDQKTFDAVRDAAVEPPGPVEGEPPAAPGPLAFSPGPTCPSFPERCDDPERVKCTLISDDPGYRTSCVPELGTREIGESCERRVRGDDDCAPGGFCSPLGQSFARENRLVCQRLCHDSKGCPEGEACIQLLSDEVVGVCAPTCTLFADERCGADELRCAAAAEASGAYVGYCEIFGTLGEGEACTLSSQCARGLSCELKTQQCRYSCDREHPCPEELRCVPLQVGVEGALRLCVP